MRGGADRAGTLQRGAGQLGIPLDAAQTDALLVYLDELLRWNRAYNLTAVRDPDEMITRHLLDSLAMIPPLHAALANPATRLLDVGSGAGLPGIVLAIVRPDLDVTVLDSNGKKARFLRHVARTLSQANVTVAEARVEDWKPPVPYRVVTSRAFASLAEFFTVTTDLLAPGGLWAAMKGKLADRELAGVPDRIHIRETVRLQVPWLDEDRHLIIAQPT
jgi:16S rRNA (guanine527-N7)-methyltransferase